MSSFVVATTTSLTIQNWGTQIKKMSGALREPAQKRADSAIKISVVRKEKSSLSNQLKKVQAQRSK
jgi:hypothetical protein